MIVPVRTVQNRIVFSYSMISNCAAGWHALSVSEGRGSDEMPIGRMVSFA